MKTSTLIKKLSDIDGETEIIIKTEYFCNDHNCEIEANIEDVFMKKDKLVLNGWEI